MGADTPVCGQDRKRARQKVIFHLKTFIAMKKVNIVFQPNAEYGEVVDSIADVFHVAYEFYSNLKDGFQWDDVLNLIGTRDDIQEVITDFPVFIDQFSQLNGATAVAAVQEAADRARNQNGELGSVGEFVFGLLLQLAQGFKFAEQTVAEGITQLNGWRSLFRNAPWQKPEES